MFSSTILKFTALLVAATAVTAQSEEPIVRLACYDGTEELHCYNGEFDIPQEVDPEDVAFIAAYLRSYGRQTRAGRLLTMAAADAPDCAEWSLYARNTALVVAKKVDMTFDSAVLFEEIANTIDGGAGSTKADGLHLCAADGGSLGVQVNEEAAAYNTPAYLEAGYKPAGIIVKVVANLSA